MSFPSIFLCTFTWQFLIEIIILEKVNVQAAVDGWVALAEGNQILYKGVI